MQYNKVLTVSDMPCLCVSPCAASSATPPRSSGAGCTHANCVGKSSEVRRSHRRNATTVGVHVGCCGGHPHGPGMASGGNRNAHWHEATCPRRPAERRHAFSIMNPVIWWLITVSVTGQDWPTGNGPYGDWLYKFSDALAVKGILHDGAEEEGDLLNHKHGHYVAKIALANDDVQTKEASKWSRDILGMGTGPGKIPGKVSC